MVRETAQGVRKGFLGQGRRLIVSLGQTPNMHQIVRSNVRRALLKRFPYCVYYRVEEQIVQIIGVFHAKRDPAAWQARISVKLFLAGAVATRHRDRAFDSFSLSFGLG